MTMLLSLSSSFMVVSALDLSSLIVSFSLRVTFCLSLVFQCCGRAETGLEGFNQGILGRMGRNSGGDGTFRKFGEEREAGDGGL